MTFEQFNDQLLVIVNKVAGFLWDPLLIILLVGTGVFLTFRLKFVQVREFIYSAKRSFQKSSKKSGTEEGKISSFQSLATSIAGQVGTGNLTGTATALLAGGPGAVFWLWVSSFLGMATIFAEASLAIHFREKTKEGKWIGGPSYYIKQAFKNSFGKFLAGLFSILIILALGFMGNMVQSNSIGVAFNNAFGVNKVIIGIVVAVLAGFIFLGGIGRIAKTTEKIVPIMGVLYILGALAFLILNINKIPQAFQMIFVGAFDPQAVVGGTIGIAVMNAVRLGIARGLFSNEAGMGSTPHAHALADVEHPCEQGAVAIMGVFAVFLVVTLTALVMLTSGVLDQVYNSNVTQATIPETLKGIGLAQESFKTKFGSIGVMFVAISLFFFAFSTIIAWYFFGEQNIRYLFGEKAVRVYSILAIIFIFIGSTLKVDLVWSLSDCFNAMMVIPNIIGVLALSGTVAVLSKNYQDFKKERDSKEK